MPFGNGTGPLGQGPMTGRGLGYCAGYSRQGYNNPTGRFFGRGMAWHRGWWGRGWTGRWPGWSYNRSYPYSLPYPFQAPTAKEEKEILAEDLKVLKAEMGAIEKRLKELENKK